MNQKKSKSSQWIKHISDAELYGNNLSEYSVELLIALYDKIKNEINKTPFISSKSRCIELLNKIENMIDEYNADLKNYFKDEMLKISETESAWLKKFLKGFGISVIIPTTLFANIKFSPIADQDNYEAVVDSLTSNINKNVSSTIKTSYMLKTPTEDVNDRLSTKVDMLRKNIEKEAQTINTSTFRITDYLIFKANKEEVIYDATLDTKTCPECASLHGKMFKASEAPLLPKHVNCRCSLVPKEVAEDGMFSSYKEWFEEQPEEDKKIILGKTRYELYEKGVPIERFFNNGIKITLKDLLPSLEINNETEV